MKTEYRTAIVMLLLITGMSVGLSGCIEPDIDIGQFNDTEDWMAFDIPPVEDWTDMGWLIAPRIERDPQIPYSQSIAPLIEGGYACNGGDSEVEVITYKSSTDLTDLLKEGCDQAKKVVKFKAGSDLATKVK